MLAYAKLLHWMCLCQQEHIPLVSILCNPGIRARHWNQMSEIVEYDLAPDYGTTLRKVLKQNLSPYLEQFESISAAASKVRAPVFFSSLQFLLQFFLCYIHEKSIECYISALFVSTGVLPGEGYANHGGCLGWHFFSPPTLQRDWCVHSHSCG